MQSKDEKPKGPSQNGFLQQTVPMVQLVFTTSCVLITLIIAGIVCTVIGSVALAYADRVVQFQFTYAGSDTCVEPCPAKVQLLDQVVSSGRCPDAPTDGSLSQPCTVKFKLEKDIPGPVYFYYTLDNFHQNHRRYVASIDLDQIKGQFGTEMPNKEPAGHSSCSFADGYTVNGKKIWYYPCGLIARTFFNDTFMLRGPDGKTVNWESNSITWNSSGADNKFISKNEEWLRKNCYSLGGPDFALSGFPPSLEGFRGTQNENTSRCVDTRSFMPVSIAITVNMLSERPCHRAYPSPSWRSEA
jgi:hypothetical protein